MRRYVVFMLLIFCTCFAAACQEQLAEDAAEHAVIVRFKYGSTDLNPLFALEKNLERAIANAGVGEYDGNEIAADGSEGILYMYGPDADKLFDVVQPILESSAFMRGATVTRRYGPPQGGVREATETIAL